MLDFIHKKIKYHSNIKRKSKFKVGDKVVILVDKQPYYSGYGGNPLVTIPKGTIGTVEAVNVPSVHRDNIYFNCVDFVLDGVYSGNPSFKQNVWRCSLFDNEIRKV